MGKIIVIEGTDGSGKETQSNLLYEKLKNKGYKVMKVSHPNYDSDSSALVKMYLNGELGENTDEINTYATSLFYAVDRYVTYIKEWKEFYDNGGIIIMDRYVDSNILYQGLKFDESEETAYSFFVKDLEYMKMRLPIPDKRVFLNVPFTYTQKLIKNRKNKINNEENKDIHEKDNNYLKKVYDYSIKYVNNHFSQWNLINCLNGENMRTIEEINNDILDVVKDIL